MVVLENIGTRLTALALATAGVFWTLATPQVQAQVQTNTDLLLRSVPISVSAYPEAAQIPSAVTSSESFTTFLDQNDNLLLHMEALRQSYPILSADTTLKQSVLNALKARYMADQSNPRKFFDYGYAQLVLDFNKNGLFFLRKANDQLNLPATNLAYGLAEIDVDLNLENGTTEGLTTRKIDVGFKLKDALSANQSLKQKGVWPTYVSILEGVRNFSAYDSMRSEDLSTLYVPYGSLNLNRKVSTAAVNFLGTTISTSPQPTVKQPVNQATNLTVDLGCGFNPTMPDPATFSVSKTADLDGDGINETLKFFRMPDGSGTPRYRVMVQNGMGQIIGDLFATKTSIVEDLEEDGRFELVIRQFNLDARHPVSVFRWNGKCYSQDKSISSFFE